MAKTIKFGTLGWMAIAGLAGGLVAEAGAQTQTVIRSGALTGEAVDVDRTPGIFPSPNPFPPTADNPRGSFVDNYLFQDEQINLDANAGIVRVLRTNQKALVNDFVTAVFPVHKAVPRELRNVLRTIIGLEGGRAEVIRDPDGGQNYIQVICPAYMVPYLEQAIPLLDESWVREYDTGSADVYYKAKNRNAGDIDTIASQYASDSGFSQVDTRNNAVSRIDEPYRIENYLRAAELVDIPSNQVFLEVKIYEVASASDLKLGLDYINWKNGPGRNLAQFIYTGADAQSRNEVFTSVFDPFVNALTGEINLIGRDLDEVKLLTDFDQFHRSVNYLLPSNYLDFLEFKGVARVALNQHQMVTSSQTALFAAEDQIVALVSTPGDLDTVGPDTLQGVSGPIAGTRFSSRIARDTDGTPILDNLGGEVPLDANGAPLIHDIVNGQFVRRLGPDGQPLTLRRAIRFGLITEGDLVADALAVGVRDSSRRLNYRNAGRTGIFVAVTPFVGLESMELVVDVQIGDLNGLAPNGQPIINARTLSTTVRLLDGEPHVIAGIKRRIDIKETAKAPGLGDLPILGYLFGGETDVKRWTDVVIVVKPHFYLPSQTDIHAPQTVKNLAQYVEHGKGLRPLPHDHYGFDQWLLDPNK